MPDPAESPPPVSDPPPGAVLIVEDDHSHRTLLSHHVERMGRPVIVAKNDHEALDRLGSEKIDLVLLDMMTPEMDGREFLARVKDRPEWRDIPVVIISAMSEAETAARCIEIGAEDYLTKPYDPLLLQARITAGLDKKRLRDREAAYLDQLLSLQRDLDRRNRELEDLNALLARAALTDPLTGLPNRRWAMDELQRCWAASARHRAPMAVLVVDVDHFKRINDKFGHDIGDEVLKAVAQRLRAAARQHEGVARIGGEEFLVLCEFTSGDGAMACGERLRMAVANSPVSHAGQDHLVTVCVGAAVRDESMAGPDQLLRAADQAVYAAKRSGRNRVVVASVVG
jgi:diguanylate cyclase (GGDEF)-like protein